MKAASFGRLLLMALVTLGCDDVFGDPEGEVEISVDRAAYVAGEDVMLRLYNGSNAGLFPDPCSRALDVRVGADWVETDLLPELPCVGPEPFEAPLPPGSEMTFSITLPENVPTGHYRLRVQARERGESAFDVATVGFDVSERAQE